MTDDTIVRLKTTSTFVFLGFLMTIGMIAGTLINPSSGQLHEVRNIQQIISELASASTFDLTIRLAGLVFDNFFIIGYLAIFYGLFLITKKQDSFFPKLAFAFGLTTGICDLIENAIQVALFTGVPNGWVPDSLVFSALWTFTFIKDIMSYVAGLIFIVLLILSLGNPLALRIHKLLLVFLLGLYVSLGSIAILEPSFLLFRNLSFMIDMLLGSLIYFHADKVLIDMQDKE